MRAPRPLAAGETAAVTASRMLAGPSVMSARHNNPKRGDHSPAEIAVEGRMAPTMTTGLSQLTVRSTARQLCMRDRARELEAH